MMKKLGQGISGRISTTSSNKNTTFKNIPTNGPPSKSNLKLFQSNHLRKKSSITSSNTKKQSTLKVSGIHSSLTSVIPKPEKKKLIKSRSND
jgi:hypothetical protein